MKKILVMAVMAVVAAMLFSCTTRPQRDVHITIEKSAAPRIHILSHDCTMSDSGTMMLVIQLKNRSYEYTEFEYKVEWLRDGGIPVDTIMSNWQKLNLMGEEVAWIKMPAPNDRVSDYRFRMRRVVK